MNVLSIRNAGKSFRDPGQTPKNDMRAFPMAKPKPHDLPVDSNHVNRSAYPFITRLLSAMHPETPQLFVFEDQSSPGESRNIAWTQHIWTRPSRIGID
ncbi:hypothetical protein CTAM01_12111 [Colletotrichum tamarilloi]|uniref:Uncharacterized protein n=1 Tax=Colletotrichum tamarilloi TaxID=1209934 RepID=A0ABQ9QVN8_9PEZI|nr:uncharacterized protein CTAM01_12111 [Colletotrichum tamarilloi]KAK1486678.1 hypothetical protein CTAM01_12111 [Colletotrichum tamarilloi]